MKLLVFSLSLPPFHHPSYLPYLYLSRTLASTHFEPTSARMAFPCFDEPSIKANYSISIRRSPAHTALSNMPVVSKHTKATWWQVDHSM